MHAQLVPAIDAAIAELEREKGKDSATTT